MRAAIVGAGLAGRWHAHSARKSGATVIGVVDADSSRAAQLAAHLGSVETFSSLLGLLSKQNPDVVHICTPTATHIDLTLQSIDAGVPVLLEKPMAQTYSEVQQLYDRANQRNVALCPVHQFLFQDGVKKILDQQSRAGEIVRLEAVIQSAGGEINGAMKLDEIAADILPHPLSLIRKFLPESVPEEGWSVIRPRSGEFYCSAAFQKISITVSVSMNARPPLASLLLAGTQGTFHADLFHGSSYFEPGTVSRRKKILRPFGSSLRSLSSTSRNLASRMIRWEPAYPGLTRLISEFYISIRTRAKSPISPDEALNVARIRDILIGQIRF